MTYITHRSHNITLLGDDHAFWPNQPLEFAHLKAILEQASEKINPCTMLIEDGNERRRRTLKDVSPKYLDTSLLGGLIQRINAFYPYIKTIEIDRGDIVGRALFFPKCFVGRAQFEDLSPKRLARSQRPNAYNLSFSDLIGEVTQFKRDLLSRRKPQHDERVHRFIDMMAYRIDEQLGRLQEILDDQQIATSASMLETTVRWWLLRTMMNRKDKIAEIQSVGWGIEDFIRDYKNGMSNKEWKQRTEDLKNRYWQIFDKEPEPVIKKPSLIAGCLTALTSMPIVRNWFSRQEEINPAPLERELVALTDPSLNFRDQNPELSECFLQLRLLLVDSHATLDIVDNLGTDITAIGGDLHIQNITKYLADLGIKQTRCIVRDASKNQMPLDLDELPI